jgi:hypothetical protein
MSRSKWLVVAASMIAGVILWTNLAQAQEDPAPKAKSPREKPADREPGKPVPPRGEDIGDWGPARPGDGARPRPKDGEFPGQPGRKPDGSGGPRPGPNGQGPMGPNPMGPNPMGPGPMGPGRPNMPGGFPMGPPRWPHQDWESLEKNDPDMFKLLKQEDDLDRQTQELSMQYRRAPAAQRDGLKKQVEKVVGQQFEVRQERRQLELKRLEGELQRLREAIEKRTKSREQLVGKRVAELLGQDEDSGF